MRTGVSKSEAIQRRYLENKKVYLKPVVRGGGMIKDPDHVAYFQIEGGNNWFQLPLGDRGEFIDPFDSEDERLFFEKELDVDLSVHKSKDNFWNTFFVKVVKDYKLMHQGAEFDLSKPLDMLRYKVLKLNHSIAPSWDTRTNRAEYRFALVDEDYEEAKGVSESNKLIEAYTYFGGIKNSPVKMRDFLGMYLMEKKQTKAVPETAEKEWLQKEIQSIIETDIDVVLKMIADEDAPIKLFILKGIRSGAIVKESRNTYKIVGEDVAMNYEEIVGYLKQAEEVKADVYLKIAARNEIGK